MPAYNQELLFKQHQVPNSAVLSEFPQSVDFTMVTFAHSVEKSRDLLYLCGEHDGNKADVETLVWSHADPNYANVWGQTPLWYSFSVRLDGCRQLAIMRSHMG